MHKGGGVQEFEGYGRVDGLLVDATAHLGRQEHQHRAQLFAATGQQMFGHLLEQGVVRGQRFFVGLAELSHLDAHQFFYVS